MTEKLPPLPQPPHFSAHPLDAWEPSEDLWDERQLREFAEAAVLAERERCAKIVEDWYLVMEDRHGREMCAAAIRSSVST